MSPFLANVTPLEIMKNPSYSRLKALFSHKIFKILSFFSIFFFFFHRVKCLYKGAKVNFKIYNFINWEANSYSTHILLKSKGKDKQTIKIGPLTE